MKKLYFASIALVGVSMYMLGQAQVDAGMLAGQQVTAGVKYEFLDCQRPDVGATPVYDVESYQKAIAGYNEMVSQVNAYLACIRDEAKRDIDIQTTVIKSAYMAESELIRLNLTEMRESMDSYAGLQREKSQ